MFWSVDVLAWTFWMGNFAWDFSVSGYFGHC